MQATDRRRVDHRAAVFTHPGLGGQRGPQQRRPKVDVKSLGEPGVILVDQRTVSRVGAGVVDQDVDAAEAFERQFDAVFGGILVDGVRRHSDCTPADVLGRRVGAVLFAGRDDHARTSGGQPLTDGQPDPPRSAGDDRGAPAQSR